MFTYDEWGNYIFHIQTGRGGAKLLEEMGIKNPSKEEYDKHMTSYRKIKKKQDEWLDELMCKLLEWCDKKK